MKENAINDELLVSDSGSGPESRLSKEPPFSKPKDYCRIVLNLKEINSTKLKPIRLSQKKLTILQNQELA